MLPEIVRLLACPICRGGLALQNRSLLCGEGHCFDLARQGYVSFVGGGGAQAGNGDTAAMVEARLRFLSAGHFDPLTRAVVEEIRRCVARDAAVVVDLGAGTGHHLGAVLESSPSSVGVALDVSKHAARAAAKAHPRIGSVVCDVWDTFPMQTDCADVILDIFAPRNSDEIARVLCPGGALVLVTPAPEHQAELVAALGLVTIDPGKAQRVERDLAGFTLQRRTPVQWVEVLDHEDIQALIEMGPTAHHVAPAEVAARLGTLPARVEVTFAVDVAVYTAA